MTLLYFDGFDMHRWPTGISGLDAGGEHDASACWYTSPQERYTFPQGYISGGSVQFRNTRTAGGRGDAKGGLRQTRWGFWAIGTPAQGGSVIGTQNELWTIDSRTGYEFLVKVYTDGRLELRQRHPADMPGGYGDPVAISQLSDGVLWDDVTWRHYELFCDFVTGAVSLKVNGIFTLSGTGVTAPQPVERARLTFGDKPRASMIGQGPWNIWVDHMYITDGTALVNTGTLGVAVVAGQDRWQTTNTGMRGSLVIGGQRFISTVKTTGWSSIGDGRNQCNIQNHFFWVNPLDGTPWSTAKFQTIEQWGLCYGAETAQGTERIVGIAIARLIWNNGLPLVVYSQAGAATSFSGPWTKSNATMSYAGHVRPMPRANIELVADTNSLYISGPGCVLFGLTDEDTLQTVGITFAEEFREDNRDWKRVTGVGSSFESLFVSGYSVLGEANKKFQNNYVTVNYENVPTGGAYIQGLWDYSTDIDTGRWSMRQSVYQTDDGYKHGSRRLKIRGHGKAMQLRVTSKGDLPFVINGWSMFITGNASV